MDTILIKDLSRLGRNYLEAGYYIELVLPAHWGGAADVSLPNDDAGTTGNSVSKERC